METLSGIKEHIESLNLRDSLILATGGLGAYLLVTSGYQKIKRAQRVSLYNVALEKRWRERVANFAEIERRIKEEELNDPESLVAWEAIVNLSLQELKEKLQSGAVRPIEAVRAFQRSALKAQRKTNCVTLFYLEADKFAIELEEKYKDIPKPAFYGVPFSVKESIAVKGYDTTVGLVQKLNDPASEDAELIALMKTAGGIPFVETTTPQCCAAFNCSTPIYGLTTHPLDPLRTPGGSSGGEGALIAQRGSLIGIGTDLAGSIRVPAHFSGIAGIKPTKPRMPKESCLKPSALSSGVVMVSSNIGPMAQDVDSLVDFLRVVWTDPLPKDVKDPYTAPIPFRENILTSKVPLRIGYYDFDGVSPAVPAIKRAVEETKVRLESAGHTLIPWNPPRVGHALKLYLQATMFGSRLFDVMNGDLPERIQTSAMKLTEPVKNTFLQFLRTKLNMWKAANPTEAMTYNYHINSAEEVRVMHASVLEYTKLFVNSWNSAGLDCVICPPNASPAMLSETAMDSLVPYTYTLLYNLLNFPAGVVKTTEVNRADEIKMNTYKADDIATRMVYDANITGTVGLPIAVQCVALPFQDELCLRLMKEVEALGD